MHIRLCALLCALLAAQTVHGYHILCIFSIPSRSHNHLGKGFVQSLLKAGHEVTWVTPFPPTTPEKGLHIIDASATRALAEGVNMASKSNNNMDFNRVMEFAANITDTTLRLPALREAIAKGQYDAVVTETFFNDVEAGYAAVLQVPWIVLSGMVLQPSTEAMVDEVRSVPVLPLLFNDANIPMSFLERLKNVALTGFINYFTWMQKSKSEAKYQTLYGPFAAARNVALPPLDAVVHNVSILFVNSHPSFCIAQSMPPNAVEIGGYHIDDTITPLPKDLEAILNASTQGVVYFSMGSVLKSSALPEATKRDLLQMFGELPYTVLWKVEEEMTGLPKNVHTRKWMPQAAILSHANTRVFITHGGMLSNIETIRYGVPTIAVPVFGDQLANAARAVRAGYARVVPYDTDTMAAGLRAALAEALGTDKYYKRAKYLSSLFNKRPVSPTKLIPHYIEIAIESKGAYHLRSKALLYPWYQIWMLDILALVLVALFVAYTIVKVIIRTILKTLGGASKAPANKNKVKKN